MSDAVVPLSLLVSVNPEATLRDRGTNKYSLAMVHGVAALVTLGAAWVAASAVDADSSLASAPCPVLLGSPCAGSPTVVAGSKQPGPPPTGRYFGSDKAGTVSFTLYAVKHRGGRSHVTLWIRDFHFASKCAASGTPVPERMRVGSRRTFRWGNASGITVSGSIYRAFTGDLFSGPPGLPAGVWGVADGIVRLRTATCDSGRLKFTARWI